MAPKKYIENMDMGYETMFGEKQSAIVNSPLKKGDHPDIDTSELLDQNGVQQYQSPIGLQWAISLVNLMLLVLRRPFCVFELHLFKDILTGQSG